MARELLVRRLCSVLALALLVPGGFVARPTTDAKQDGPTASSRERPEAAGDLDPTFGKGGLVTTDFFGNSDGADSVAIQPDGKIVLAGAAYHNTDFSTSDFALARYNPDGSLDQGFGSGGKQTTDFFGNRDEAYGVALQPDGKIVAVGVALHSGSSATANFALARYNPDGSLDQTFGSGGKQTTDFFGNTDFAFSVVIQTDGKIVLAGYAAHGGSNATGFALARYNPDGSLDQSFGSGGKVTTDFFGNESLARIVAIQPDGKLVAAGYTFQLGSPSTADFAVARYNPDGSLDQAFGAGGKQTTDFFGGFDAAQSVTIQPDGKIVVAGYAEHGADYSTAVFALARYNRDGSLDQTFAAGGKQTAGFFGNGDAPGGVAIQPDGKIVLVGTAGRSSSTADFALARYNPDGGLDQTFASGGTETTHFFGNTDNDGAAAVALQSDGKIVLAGVAQPNNTFSTADFALARYSGGLVAPDFSISFNPSSVTAQAGTKARVAVLINRTGGFNGNVTVTPPDAAMGIRPKPPDPVVTTADSAVFKMKVGGGVPSGPYDRTFTAMDDSGRIRTATVTIVVQ